MVTGSSGQDAVPVTTFGVVVLLAVVVIASVGGKAQREPGKAG